MSIKNIALSLVMGLALVQGAQAGIVTESCTDCPLAIGPDGGTTTSSTLSFLTTGSIEDVDIFVNLTHTFTGDLDIFIDHGGTTVQLFDQEGGAGDNITGVTFDDEAAASITSGTPPFGPGSFQPSPGLLSAFDGDDVNGDWTLRVVDNFFGDAGTLLNWSVIATTAMVPVPGTVALLVVGLAGVRLMRRRAKSAA